ncbi:MAG: glycosyltransferase family 39 protein [Candidatus Pacearchaeota archaeon]
MKDKTAKVIKKEYFFLLSFILGFSVIWVYYFINWSSTASQDAFWYVRLSENLIKGKGYTLDGNYPHAQYPPGLPILLTPFSLFLSNNQHLGIILIYFFAVISIILSFFIGKELFGVFGGMVSSFLITLNSIFIANSTLICSEIPFLFFSTLGLYLFIKSYEKRNLIIPATACLSFSALIRYDGLLLIFPIAFYMFLRKKDFEDFFFSKKTFIAIGIAILILGPWFLRNFIVFGNPFANSYNSGDTGITFQHTLEYLFLLKDAGVFFVIFFIGGFIIFLFKEYKNKMLATFFVWFVVYTLLHIWWWSRSLRFYCEVLIIMVLFSTLFFVFIFNRLKKINKKYFYLIVFLVTLLYAFEQIFVFLPKQDQIIIFNFYDPIKQISEYSSQNLPKDAVLVVPEWVVYTTFIKDKNILDYRSGFNYLLSTNNTIYFFTDNLHSWLVDPFYPKEGKIVLQVQTQQGFPVKLEMKAKEIKTFEKQLRDREINATLWEIKGFRIIS